jgi:hypothetical protein
MTLRRNTSKLSFLLVVMALSACEGDGDDPVAARDAGASPLSSLPNDVIVEWNEHTVAAIVASDGYADPLVASRAFAIVHLAMHDAVNASAHRGYRSYAYDERDHAAHPVAAAASAAHRVLSGLYEAQADDLSAKLADSLARVPNGRGRKRGVALGERVGAALLEARKDDGSAVNLSYTPGAKPGDYQLTMPDVIAHPGWEKVKPFGLDSSAQFRPKPHPSLDSAQYTAAFNEVKSKGAVDGHSRTADETTYAKFWYEFSDRGWNRVTNVVARQEGLGLYATARLFALVNMALADSYIAGWDAKFHYDFWRPVTAIRAADTDGNADTATDAEWDAFLMTPPVQDYPSTHSVLGAAAAKVLELAFGQREEPIAFSMTSTSAIDPNAERSFDSFAEAARENADSRVMAGIHFRFSCDAGLEQGQHIGQHVFANHLQSIR